MDAFIHSPGLVAAKLGGRRTVFGGLDVVLATGADCPKGEYCPLHYWAPGIYKVRANVHPSNLDQYTAGPCPPVAAATETIKYPCRTVGPAPTAPYAAPAEYFGRQVIVEP